MQVESRIKGAFKGWAGKTVFKLENGQVWEQSRYAYHYQYAYRPKVVISGTGTEREMQVEGVAGFLHVKRVR